jgi:hypothetical protein
MLGRWSKRRRIGCCGAPIGRTPNLSHVPDDGALVDLLASIAPSEAKLRALLVTNPERLYRFGAER